MNGLKRFAIYLGIGAMCHALFYSATFDWNSAWTWGWLLAWPVALFVWFWSVVLIVIAISAVTGIALVFWTALNDRSRKGAKS
ncbi:hypothetical protein [Azorhizobium caulinodans]|uniref:hypothetical protein n=1 Tax=Azorhizobium caulinodans TaxID=7 RepID=UPI002FBF13A3